MWSLVTSLKSPMLTKNYQPLRDIHLQKEQLELRSSHSYEEILEQIELLD